jgi:hypothetical protein
LDVQIKRVLNGVHQATPLVTSKKGLALGLDRAKAKKAGDVFRLEDLFSDDGWDRIPLRRVSAASFDKRSNPRYRRWPRPKNSDQQGGLPKMLTDCPAKVVLDILFSKVASYSQLMIGYVDFPRRDPAEFDDKCYNQGNRFVLGIETLSASVDQFRG